MTGPVLTPDSLNRNMLSDLGYRFTIKKLPEFNFFVQEVELPGIELGVYNQPTPFKEIPIIGDHVQYAPMTATFKINEDLGNYLQVMDWIRAIGFPEKFEQHRAIEILQKYGGEGIYSDATLIILSSSMNPFLEVKIEDLFPFALTGLRFSSKGSTVEYLEATVSFAIKDYTITPIV